MPQQLSPQLPVNQSCPRAIFKTLVVQPRQQWRHGSRVCRQHRSSRDRARIGRRVQSFWRFKEVLHAASGLPSSIGTALSLSTYGLSVFFPASGWLGSPQDLLSLSLTTAGMLWTLFEHLTVRSCLPCNLVHVLFYCVTNKIVILDCTQASKVGEWRCLVRPEDPPLPAEVATR